MEAIFGQLNFGFKRLITPNQIGPDCLPAHSTAPTLPWWDQIRYMWRGCAAISIRGVGIVLAHGHNPHICAHETRSALSAASLHVSKAGGRIEIKTADLSVVAYARAPDAGAGARGRLRWAAGRTGSQAVWWRTALWDAIY